MKFSCLCPVGCLSLAEPLTELKNFQVFMFLLYYSLAIAKEIVFPTLKFRIVIVIKTICYCSKTPIISNLKTWPKQSDRNFRIRVSEFVVGSGKQDMHPTYS